jgi:hypothetical protein
MDTLGKFKTNFLKDRSSFKIGFNNRSPLSQVKYSKPGSSMQHSYSIPKLSPTIGKDGKSILVPDDGRIEAGMMIGKAISEAGQKVGKALEAHLDKKKEKKEEKKEDPKNKLKKGSFAQKTLDPEGYQNYITARDEAKIKDIDFDDIFDLTL